MRDQDIPTKLRETPLLLNRYLIKNDQQAIQNQNEQLLKILSPNPNQEYYYTLRTCTENKLDWLFVFNQQTTQNNFFFLLEPEV